MEYGQDTAVIFREPAIVDGRQFRGQLCPLVLEFLLPFSAVPAAVAGEETGVDRAHDAAGIVHIGVDRLRLVHRAGHARRSDERLRSQAEEYRKAHQ